MANPILDFGIDVSKLEFIGQGLQRPECILAEKDGTLWSADSRGGVVRLRHDGTQKIVTQRISEHFAYADSEATRYLTGTLPNGLAFAANRDILISNFGTDRLEIMTRTGDSRVLADGVGVEFADALAEAAGRFFRCAVEANILDVGPCGVIAVGLLFAAADAEDGVASLIKAQSEVAPDVACAP